MALPDLAAADPVAALFTWLTGAGSVEAGAVLGGSAVDHITGEMEPAWPHVVLSTGPGGDLGDFQWNLEHEVLLEVYGSPAGVPGEGDLWKVIVRVAQLLCDIPNRETVAGEPVISVVRPSGVLAFQELPTGHPRWTLGLTVVLHPPN